MKHMKLTKRACAAHTAPMTGVKRAAGAVIAMVGASALSGCINLEAPDKPIVIELNINITQEVIYRLAEDAENTIDENADIF